MVLEKSRHRLALLSVVLTLPLLANGPCSGTDGEDLPANGSSGGGTSVDSLIPCSVTLTVEQEQITRGNPATLGVGGTVTYYFVDANTVQGEGLNTLPTQSWSYTKTGSDRGTVNLDYGQYGTEVYNFIFETASSGAFDGEGNTPNAGVYYVGRFTVSCEEAQGGCSDTCIYANDGVCDDGGPGSQFSVCDYGTDCTDCGPRGDDGGDGDGDGDGDGGSPTCKQPCLDHSDCSPGEWCTEVTEGLKCLPTECETECFANNLSCFSNNTTCEFEMCGDPDPDASDTCRQPCSSAVDCNSGEDCIVTGDGPECLPLECNGCFDQGLTCTGNWATCEFEMCVAG